MAAAAGVERPEMIIAFTGLFITPSASVTPFCSMYVETASIFARQVSNKTSMSVSLESSSHEAESRKIRLNR